MEEGFSQASSAQAQGSDLSLELCEEIVQYHPATCLVDYMFLTRHIQAVYYPKQKGTEWEELASKSMTEPSVEALHEQTVDRA